jgi:hypothetical protein
VGGVGSVPGTVQPGFNPSGVASASVPVARPTPPAARSLHAPTDVAGGVRARPLARGPVSVSRAVGAREVDELLTRCDAREGDLRQRRDGRKKKLHNGKKTAARLLCCFGPRTLARRARVRDGAPAFTLAFRESAGSFLISGTTVIAVVGSVIGPPSRLAPPSRRPARASAIIG